MADKTFYPTHAGFTTANVLEMIKQRQSESGNEFAALRAPDSDKLTDERMQKFVDEWHNAYFMAQEFDTAEDMAQREEDALLSLATDIQKDH